MFQIPELLQEFPSIVSEKVLQPMSYISPSEEEQRLLSSSVNSSVVLRMMGGARGSAPPIRGRGTSIGPDRGRGRGKYFLEKILFRPTWQNYLCQRVFHEYSSNLLNTRISLNLQGEDVEMGAFIETLTKTVLGV